MPPTTWSHLRKTIKNCPYTDCPRNENKLPILFGREETSLSKIKIAIVSQDPGASLREKFSCSGEIEEYLVRECASPLLPKNKRGLPYRMRKIFSKSFDLRNDEIYWTHALKCVPKENDREIGKMWKECAPYCVNHFKNELKLIPSNELVIIAIGNYALALCRYLLEDKPLKRAKGIMEFVRNIDPEKKFTFNEKEISLFPFLHPSHREQVLRRWDKNCEIKNKEKKFIEMIRRI